MVTKHVVIYGRVQGVAYRDSMRVRAEQLGVTGWVRNRRDSCVEAIVQGETDAVDAIVAWARRGPPSARVTKVDVDNGSGEFTSFDIVPSA